MKQALIEFREVSFSYHTETVFNHLNLAIAAGEYLGVIGPNGGGKTTFVKLLLGLVAPQKGQVLLWGETAQHFRERYKIGYVPQRAGNLDFRLPITVREVTEFGAIHTKNKSVVDDALQQVGMRAFAERPLRELSGGQQQKAFIAKALAGQPQVLVLDEPTVGVDVKAQDEFYQLIADLNKKQGLTIIMVSHDIDVVMNEVSKLVCINEGLVYHGHPKEFIEKDYLTKLYGKTRRFILHGH
jgi:zinc transport system ATP-binding protein